ncbi:MAG: N-acetylmuramoyl-L-alanine amidase [Caedibacter sp. 37-49]|nr:MAG: N-acetylmuramoyl-L-alanine amidase [Caedibacter sp. 37-49]
MNPFLLSILFLFLLGEKPLTATSIENIFPEAFKPRIMVHPKNIYGVNGYEVEKFTEEPNRNHWDTRGGKEVSCLVMHYTVVNYADTMRLFTANLPDGRVSAHYVITEEERENGVKAGVVTQIVPEEERAWHAGVSYWRGIENLNAHSIGIENVNKGFIKNKGQGQEWFPFDLDQVATLGQISAGIVKKYNIHPTNVVAHADIIPTLREDPGVLFPWGELYTKYGVGAWLTPEERQISYVSKTYLPKEPFPQGISEAFFLKCLREYGYKCPEGASSITPELRPIVKAFKAHFSHNQQPDHYTETLDETAMLWAWGLDAKYPQGKKSIK